MWIVTPDAGLDGIVRDRINLRKAAGPGWVIAVAQDAVLPLEGQNGFVVPWRLGVRDRGSVASLARNRLMV